MPAECYSKKHEVAVAGGGIAGIAAALAAAVFPSIISLVAMAEFSLLCINDEINSHEFQSAGNARSTEAEK
jgi:succinate dehydrogenase/fumarate reductase flavoprotein subunit